MKGKLLSVEEVANLKPSSNKYYVVSNNSQIPDGVYTNIEGNNFRDNNNLPSFSKKCYGVEYGNIKVYEYEEEIIIKEYKTWELLKLAEDYKNEGISTDKRPRYKNNKGIEVIIGTTGGDKGLFTIEGRTYKDFLTNEIWTLVEPKQVEVTFMEAVKALENGKDIRCEILNDTYHYKAEDNFDEALGYTFIDYVYGNPISTKEILEGQWFINN